MKVLAFDTSTDACTVALQFGDTVRVDHREAQQQHARLLLPMIGSLLDQAGLDVRQLDAIVVGRGPGSFTGVRVGIAAAQGLALGAGLGCLPVSTLLALCQGCHRESGSQEVVALIDARMAEVYALQGRVEQGVMQAVSDEWLQAPASLCDTLAEKVGPASVLCGSGAERYREHWSSLAGLASDANQGNRLPEARDLLTLAAPAIAQGGLLPPDALEPVYLRNKVAETEAERAARRSDAG